MKKLLTIPFLLFGICITTTAQTTYPEMILVEKGSFTMGDVEGDGRNNEQPSLS